MPVVRCYVPSCEGTDPEVAIPADSELRKKWFSALDIKRGGTRDYLFSKGLTKICKGHFQFPGEENDPEAVPRKKLRNSTTQSNDGEAMEEPSGEEVKPKVEDENQQSTAKKPTESDKKDCQRARVVLTRVDTNKQERPAEVKANLSLEATSQQIKTLFRIKDDVEALCEGSFSHNFNFGHVVLLATEFYKSKNPELKEGWKTLLPAEDLPTDEEQNMADIRPIKINMSCSSGTLAEFQNNLKTIFSKLRKFEPSMTVYWVLNEVFRFALANESEFMKLTRPKVSLSQPKKRVRVRCEVCHDWCGALEYCGAFTCNKCRLFFQSINRERTLFSLRCAKDNQCDLSVDLSCRRCRADKCLQLGMLEQFHESEMQHPMSKVCVACTSSDSGDDDVTLRLIRGHLLCTRCQGFFDQTVELNQREHRPAQPIAFRNVYECKEEEKDCVITSTSRNCNACLWDKMVRLGLDATFLTKFQGFKAFSPSFGDDDLCAVCDNEASDMPWMGQMVCQPCRSFLELSMRLEANLGYCCPNGENNRLCPIINSVLMAADDDEEDDCRQTSLVPVATRCKYCWFRRLEIEGLVDRWMMCGGRTELWIDLDDMEDNEDFDSEDVEISFKQEAEVKSEIVT